MGRTGEPVSSRRGAPCYRCIFPEAPAPELAPSCAEAGVFGVLPGTIGTIQATEAIKQLTNTGSTLNGRVLLLDAMHMQWRTLKLTADPGCPVCGNQTNLLHQQ
jgi:adenylyltransferase/sulfurtransferase